MYRFRDVIRIGAKQAHVSGGPPVDPASLHDIGALTTYQTAIARAVPQSLQPTALSKARTLAATLPPPRLNPLRYANDQKRTINLWHMPTRQTSEDILEDDRPPTEMQSS
jgi:hypothetical protein